MPRNQSLLDRRTFTVQAALLALSGVSITVGGCGGGGGSPTTGNPPPTAGPGDKVGTISANHGHSAVISAAELVRGTDFDLNIRGSSGHPHTVRVTAADLTQIAAGTRVTRTSSNDDGHTHDVTFNG